MRKLVIAAALFAFTSQAQAVCKQNQMAGNWQLFYEQFHCTLALANDGKIKSGNCTYQGKPGSTENISYPLRGKMNMKPNCRVVGTMTLAAASPFTDPFQLKITQSRTRKDTQYWSGVAWHNRREESASFHAVRVGRHN